jgi:uncharacterized protein (UPF0264 family)
MQLLVSVRDEREAAAALAGGADIIDAKEPARGPLGPVEADVLRNIAARVPPTVPLSAALGDFAELDEVRAAVIGARVPDRRDAPFYLKLAFAGTHSADRVTTLLRAARLSVASDRQPRVLVAVAYADHEAAGSPRAEELLRSALVAGVGGFLVDTWMKDGHGLLDHLPPARLAALSSTARDAGLLFALAGSLGPVEVERLTHLADVIGVRGGACRGGRQGAVDPARVRELRRRLGGARPALSSPG